MNKGIDFFINSLFTQWDDYEDRKVDNTINGDYEIDTAYANDTGLYETGINFKKNHWIIVEEYKTKKQALVGHKKWVKKMDKKPKSAYSVQMGEMIKFMEGK